MKRREFSNPASVAGRCFCGAVRFEIDYPAFWAWHDHSRASRLAHGAAYTTYVGSSRKRFRVTAGEREITHYEDKPGRNGAQFLPPLRNAAHLRAHPLAPHGQHPACSFRESHRPPAAVSRGHRGLQDWTYT